MTGVSTALPRPASPGALLAWTAAHWRDRGTWASAGYLGTSALLAPLWGTVLATALGTLWWGPLSAPFVIGTLALARQGARLERERLQALLGLRVREPYRRLTAPTLPRRLRQAARDPATWRDLLHLVLLVPVGLVALVTLALPLLAVAAIALPFVPGGVAVPLGVLTLDTPLEAVAVAVLGLVVLPFVPFAYRGAAVAHGELGRALLGPSASALVARVDELATSRTRALEAAAAERRRIERDLHDGAQQRLVALALDLGMARERFSSDPEAARALVDKAHDEAKRALAELRDLARGIHPAVLTDRGLDAALSALAGRSPVPVTVDVDLPVRPPAEVEATAYFVVAEALTNVARHSGADRAAVRVAVEDGAMVVQVADDGVGGARPDRGSGLPGLADRVAALDGRLTVTSPRGGPTTVTAVIPL